MADGSQPSSRRRRLRRRPRYSGPSFNRVVPNMLTLLGLCAGLTAIRDAIDARWQHACIAIIVAGIIDGIDGRIARLLKATSRFGAEFDSLSDFCSFGVAPAFVLYLWSLHGVGRFGFVPCLIFVVCMALRLARFNASIDGVARPAYAYNFFAGVPAPAGAGLALLPLFGWFVATEYGASRVASAIASPAVPAIAMLGTATLLVSSLPVWSFKNFKVPSSYVLPLLLGTGLFAAVVVSDPWAAMGALGLTYLFALPASLRSFHRLRADAERERAPHASTAPLPGQTA